jgi:aldehyde dehydrogenase (NAD+)
MKDMNTEVGRVFAAQREFQHVVKRTTAAERIAKLERLKAALESHAPEFMQALAEDTGKPPLEAFIELGGPMAELSDMIANLAAWMEPEEIGLSEHAVPGSVGRVVREPKGQVLIFGPWNFPAGLLFQPLVGAIGAGNVCMLKPSELTPKTSAVSARIIRELFEENEVAVFEGGPDVAEALLALPFDHIFFTGSTKVGKLVMAAAAKHLSTVTLELGGKSPAIVDEEVDIALTAQRISWGKFANAGQICISPDHVYLPSSKRDAFVEAVKTYIAQAYRGTGSFNTADFAQIVDSRNLQRLTQLIEDATERGAKVVEGGDVVGDRRLAPMVLIDVPEDAAIMQEEIFGPIMPILTYEAIDKVIDRVNSRDKPLALYVFSNNEKFVEDVIGRTSSGGVTVNDVIRHVAEANLPFGGAGPSGHGNYHGKYSFLAFSHTRSVYYQSPRDNPGEAVTRPPFEGKLEALLGSVG